MSLHYHDLSKYFLWVWSFLLRKIIQGTKYFIPRIYEGKIPIWQNAHMEKLPYGKIPMWQNSHIITAYKLSCNSQGGIEEMDRHTLLTVQVNDVIWICWMLYKYAK